VGVRERWQANETAFGGWCTIGSPFAAEVLAHEGFDYVCVDCQHGLIHYDAMWPMLQALRAGAATAVVRVPFNDTAWPGKALDAGAQAVIVPMVNSRAEAEKAVASCRYAPEGVRSFGPVRAGMVVGDDPPAVNREVMCLVMIETVRAVEAADAICATPGLDGVYVGPADLAVSMGGSLAAMASKEHADAVEEVRRACARHGIAAGIHTGGGAAARAYADAGFGMCTVSTDAALLRVSARRELAAARGAESDGAAKGPYG
jgi:4-hydroxy-2-oxoheptanedioate aldolase